MRISGPDRYRLSFTSTSFTVLCQKGTAKFSGIAASRKPKLYIVSVDEKLIYVGVTTHPLRNRLRLGWNYGEDGYCGYKWRFHFGEANIDVWCHEDEPDNNLSLDIETVEGEVVFLIRSAGQWPLLQTELHFHPPLTAHRDIAASIMDRYAFRANPSKRMLRDEVA